MEFGRCEQPLCTSSAEPSASPGSNLCCRSAEPWVVIEERPLVLSHWAQSVRTPYNKNFLTWLGKADNLGTLPLLDRILFLDRSRERPRTKVDTLLVAATSPT